MRLHRLILNNFRGIEHREITFPDDGVIIIYGPNEVGKTSMIDALDLLLEARDRSTKREIRQVKPVSADVGTEITAEISTGAYRFVYRKRFNKRPETALTVLAPRREQLTGDEAHERVTAILADTVDTTLWRAQRVLQGAATAAAELSGCDALARALDIAAGDSAMLTGAETLLIDKIDSEYGRYFTPTGRPTGEWATAQQRLTTAERRITQWKTAVEEVEAAVARHAELGTQLVELDGRRSAVNARHTAAGAAAERVAALTAAAQAAQLQVAKAAAASAGSKAAHQERIRSREEVDVGIVELARLETETAEAVAAAKTASAEQVGADAALRDADQLLAAAKQRTETARRVVDRLAELEQADRLATRLARIDDAARERESVLATLESITLTDDIMREIEDAANAVDLAAAQLAAVSATVEVTATADLELVAGGERMVLGAGQGWSATAPTMIGIPGMLELRVSSGEVARQATAKHAAAQKDLTAALAAGAVSDLSAARDAIRRRRELQASLNELNATLGALCGDDEQPDQLRDLLEKLRTAQHVDSELTGIDSTKARAELDAAGEDRMQAESHREGRLSAASSATARQAEKAAHATVLQGRLNTERAALGTAKDGLAAQRLAASDETLRAAADADETALSVATRQFAEVSGQLSQALPESVAAELAEAAGAVEELRKLRGAAERELAKVITELEVLGREGRQSRMAAAEADYEQALAEHVAVRSRADAARLLRSTMLRHRDDTRKRYVEPFRTELERLGCTVFGPTFEVEVDSELCITTRTLNGCTVPYEALSGGAKEQLAILTRLAGAALVAKEDTVPVLIDDALGFTDPDRLHSMGAVFDSMGNNGQVIVLTCSPDRYRSVADAHRIDLSA